MGIIYLYAVVHGNRAGTGWEFSSYIVAMENKQNEHFPSSSDGP